MSATYSVDWQNAYGEALGNFTNFMSLNYTRTFNNKGALTMTIPNVITANSINRDDRLIVKRKVGNMLPYNDTDTFWLVRQVLFNADTREWTIKADDPLSIISRRLVAYPALTEYSDKTLESWDINKVVRALPVADDMIKEFVYENLGAGCLDADRDISDYFTIDTDKSLGAVVEKAAAYQNLLSTIQDVANQSAQSGTPIYFDMILRPDNTLLFTTFANLRGTNRGQSSGNPLLFNGSVNIENLNLTWDYSKELNYAYMAGDGGTADTQLLVEVEDTDRSSLSPWNRNELFQDLGNETTNEGFMQAEGEELLYGSRPKLIVTGNPIDSPGYEYGINYFYGDIVEVNVQGFALDCTIDSVAVNVANGIEKVTTRLLGEITL